MVAAVSQQSLDQCVYALAGMPEKDRSPSVAVVRTTIIQQSTAVAATIGASAVRRLCRQSAPALSSIPAATIPVRDTGFAGERAGRDVSSLCLFDARACRRSHADDQQDRVLVLGAVPVHLLAVVGNDSAGRHGDGVVRIELVAGADPPSALEHGDEPVVWMEMRAAEIVAIQPFVENDIQTFLGRIANQHCILIARTRRAFPFDLVGKNKGDCRWIELGSARNAAT